MVWAGDEVDRESEREREESKWRWKGCLLLGWFYRTNDNILPNASHDVRIPYWAIERSLSVEHLSLARAWHHFALCAPSVTENGYARLCVCWCVCYCHHYYLPGGYVRARVWVCWCSRAFVYVCVCVWWRVLPWLFSSAPGIYACCVRYTLMFNGTIAIRQHKEKQKYGWKRAYKHTAHRQKIDFDNRRGIWCSWRHFLHLDARLCNGGIYCKIQTYIHSIPFPNHVRNIEICMCIIYTYCWCLMVMMEPLAMLAVNRTVAYFKIIFP